jgi:hypothetical protein
MMPTRTRIELHKYPLTDNLGNIIRIISSQLSLAWFLNSHIAAKIQYKVNKDK